MSNVIELRTKTQAVFEKFKTDMASANTEDPVVLASRRIKPRLLDDRREAASAQHDIDTGIYRLINSGKGGLDAAVTHLLRRLQELKNCGE